MVDDFLFWSKPLNLTLCFKNDYNKICKDMKVVDEAWELKPVCCKKNHVEL